MTYNLQLPSHEDSDYNWKINSVFKSQVEPFLTTISRTVSISKITIKELRLEIKVLKQRLDER